MIRKLTAGSTNYGRLVSVYYYSSFFIKKAGRKTGERLRRRASGEGCVHRLSYLLLFEYNCKDRSFSGGAFHAYSPAVSFGYGFCYGKAETVAAF